MRYIKQLLMLTTILLLVLSLTACNNSTMEKRIITPNKNTEADRGIKDAVNDKITNKSDTNSNNTDNANTNSTDAGADPADAPASVKLTTQSEYKRASNLLLQLRKNNDTNITVSPMSIEIALSMVGNMLDEQGTSDIETYFGKSIAEINDEVLEYLELKAADIETNNQIDEEEKNREDDPYGFMLSVPKNSSLYIANALWLREKVISNLNEDVNNTLKNYYKSELETFNNTFEPINNWVKENTHDMIDSVGNGEVPDNLRSILINTIYFNGIWRDPFEEDNTEKKDFKLADGSTIQVDMMQDTVSGYMETSDVEAFSKNYNSGYKFIGIRPKDGIDIDEEFIRKLDIEKLLDSETSKYDVKIQVPKFDLKYEAGLVETLNNLGLQNIFRQNGAGKVLNYTSDLTLDSVIHKTAIKMDEKGTEAAAMTAMMFTENAMIIQELPKVKEVFLDRPFMYLILDCNTEEPRVLFTGIIDNPLESQ